MKIMTQWINRLDGWAAYEKGEFPMNYTDEFQSNLRKSIVIETYTNVYSVPSEQDYELY